MQKNNSCSSNDHHSCSRIPFPKKNKKLLLTIPHSLYPVSLIKIPIGSVVTGYKYPSNSITRDKIKTKMQRNPPTKIPTVKYKNQNMKNTRLAT